MSLVTLRLPDASKERLRPHSWHTSATLCLGRLGGAMTLARGARWDPSAASRACYKEALIILRQLQFCPSPNEEVRMGGVSERECAL